MSPEEHTPADANGPAGPGRMAKAGITAVIRSWWMGWRWPFDRYGPYTALPHSSKTRSENAPDLSGRGHLGKLERETGLEPATLSLGS